MTNKILNQSQAEAVYSAMCALNNVGMRIDANIRATRVVEGPGGGVVVFGYAQPTEQYANQSAFATAYGLQQG